MPELPEVETIRKQLHPLLSGLQIVDAGSHPSAKFSSAVEAIGCQIRGVSRRGKYLIFALSDQVGADNSAGSSASLSETHARAQHEALSDQASADGSAGSSASLSEACELIIHLGMTGRLAVSPSADLSHPHLRAWWHLDNNQTLTFHDIRRFGRVYVVAAGRYENIATLSRLGPEPFSDEFTGEALWRSLRLSSRYLKTQLLSQRPVAGVGNIYADEALWLAEINPAARSLSKPRATRLAETIRTALASGLRHGGTTLRDYASLNGSGGNQDYLHCYGRSGAPCERCGVELRRRVIDARGTTWCPICQRR